MYEVRLSTGHLGQDFESLSDAEAWLNRCISKNTFGKPERWLTKDQFTDNESATTAEEVRLVSRPDGDDYNEYLFLCEYSYEIVDVTAKYEAEQILVRRRKEYGSVQDQLAEIFYDMDAWKARIQGIKDKYPKE